MSGLPILTVQEMVQMETQLLKSAAFGAETLMENVGLGMARVLVSEFGSVGATSNTLHVGIVCGWGNNGGDGFVIARILAGLPQFRVTIFEVYPERMTSRAAMRAREAIPSEVRRVHVNENEVAALFSKIDVIVDGLFGIGLNRELGKFEVGLIEAINQAGHSSVPIVSLDVPSGLDATTGKHWGAVVLADLTITVGAYKVGQWVGIGLAACGRICKETAGFPEQSVSCAAQSFLGFGLENVEGLLPKRSQSSHKYSNGKVLIIAGSEGMWGAAILAVTAALRTGAGHVTVASFSSPMPVVQVLPEVLSLDLSTTEIDFSKYDACLVGPGLKDDLRLEKVLKQMAGGSFSRVVVDATALAVYARLQSQLDFVKATKEWILTPHEGEARKLFGGIDRQVPPDRFQLYEGLSRRIPCVVVLKGPKSWIFSGKQKPVAISLTGNDALAKAGSGDVLAGVVVALYSQMKNPNDVAVLGCVVHGAAGDLWASSHGRRSLLVSELPGLVGDVLSILEGDSAK